MPSSVSSRSAISSDLVGFLTFESQDQRKNPMGRSLHMYGIPLACYFIWPNGQTHKAAVAADHARKRYSKARSSGCGCLHLGLWQRFWLYAKEQVEGGGVLTRRD